MIVYDIQSDLWNTRYLIWALYNVFLNLEPFKNIWVLIKYKIVYCSKLKTMYNAWIRYCLCSVSQVRFIRVTSGFCHQLLILTFESGGKIALLWKSMQNTSYTVVGIIKWQFQECGTYITHTHFYTTVCRSRWIEVTLIWDKVYPNSSQ